MRLLTDKYKWDYSVFEDAYNDVLSTDFIIKRYWRKPVMSSDKKMKAQLFLDFNNERIDVDLVIRDRMGKIEIARKHIKTVQPHMFFVDYELDKVKWKDKSDSIMDKKSGKEYRLSL